MGIWRGVDVGFRVRTVSLAFVLVVPLVSAISDRRVAVLVFVFISDAGVSGARFHCGDVGAFAPLESKSTSLSVSIFEWQS